MEKQASFLTKQMIKRKIGERIRYERLKRKLTIDELSEVLGLTTGALGLIELGKRGTTHVTLVTLSDYFGISIGDFYQGVTEELDISPEIDAKRKLLASLIFHLDENELEFIVAMVRNFRQFIKG